MTLKDFIGSVLKRWYLVLIVVIVAGALGYTISSFAIKKEYSSVSRVMIIVESDNENTSYLTINKYATAVALEQRTSTDLFINLSKTLEEKGVGKYDYKDLRKNMKFTQGNKETNIIDLEFTALSPKIAYDVMTNFLDVYKSMLGTFLYGTEPIQMLLVENARFIEEPVSPNVLMNTIIVCLVGFVLSVLLILLLDTGDSRLINVREIGKKFNTVVLGEIPDCTKLSNRGEDYGKIAQ